MMLMQANYNRQYKDSCQPISIRQQFHKQYNICFV